MSPILQGLANGSVRGYGGYLPLGPSTAFESIASATGTGSSGVITFSSIPNTYTSLQIRYLMFTSSAGNSLEIQFNSDTASNYAFHLLYGGGASVSASGYANQTYIPPGSNLTGPTATSPVVGIIDIHDYASTTRNKTVRAFAGVDTNGGGDVDLISGLWRSTSAITSITCKTSASNWTTNTTFALYGIKGA